MKLNFIVGGGSATDSQLEMYKKTVPLQRMGQRYEMANAVVFLASSVGSYITGTTLVADGGDWLSAPNSMSYLKSKL